MAKECAQCGEPYYRRNLTEVWVERNPGHRTGWSKRLVRLCMSCMDVATARRVLMITGVKFGGRKQARSATG